MKGERTLTKTTRLVLFCLIVAMAAALLIAQNAKPPVIPKGAKAVSGEVAAVSGKGAVATFAVERDQAQSQSLAQDQSLAASQDVSAATRARAQADYLALSRAMSEETEIESLLSVKGFPSSAVLITPRGAVVVVGKRALTSEEAFEIAETVHQVSGLPVTGVSVVPR